MTFTTRVSSLLAPAIAAVTAITISGCAALGVSAVPASTPSSSTVHSTFKETPYDNLNHYAARDSASDPSLKSAAKAFGVSSLYAVDGNSPAQLGASSITAVVGTYAKNCLMTVSYNQKYSEYALPRVPKYFVTVFNRYGLPKYVDYDTASYKTVKTFLAAHAKHCK